MITIYDYEDLEEFYDERSNSYYFPDDIQIGCFVADLFDENDNHSDVFSDGNIYVECSLFGRELRAKGVYGELIYFDVIKCEEITAKKLHGDIIIADYIDCQKIYYFDICIATKKLKYDKIEKAIGDNSCHLCLKDLYHENKQKSVI
jgi:hypothetical protein